MDSHIINLIRYIHTDFKGCLKRELKLKKIPIETKHASLFAILYEADEKIEFKRLVEKWKRSKSTLSETINKYVAAGILKKENTSTDKRVVYISLTELGKTYSESFRSIYSSYCSQVGKSLGTENEEVLIKLLKEVVVGIDNKNSRM